MQLHTNINAFAMQYQCFLKSEGMNFETKGYEGFTFSVTFLPQLDSFQSATRRLYKCQSSTLPLHFVKNWKTITNEPDFNKYYLYLK